jgi:putative membrane protein
VVLHETSTPDDRDLRPFTCAEGRRTLRSAKGQEEPLMWWWDGWSWWSGPLMTVGMLAFWGSLAWVIVMAIRASQPSRTSDLAENVLAERFARGEIDEAEYQRRLEALRSFAGRR